MLLPASFADEVTLVVNRGHTQPVYSVSFSPDGKTLATAGEDTAIKLWDVPTGRELATLRGHSSWVYSVAFSPDGTLLASGSGDTTVKIWNTRTLQELRTLTGHQNHVHAVAFSPDGKRLVSGSQDKSIKVWEVATGQELATLKGHLEYVSAVTFSADGKFIASASADKTVKLWNAQTYSKSPALSTKLEKLADSDHHTSFFAVDLKPEGLNGFQTDMNWIGYKHPGDYSFFGGGNVPFHLTNKVLSPTPALTIPVSAQGVKRLCLLISGQDLQKYKDSKVGEVALHFTDGTVVTAPIVAMRNIRETSAYVSKETPLINVPGSKITNVQVEDFDSQGQPARDYLDMLEIPISDNNKNLQAVRICDMHGSVMETPGYLPILVPGNIRLEAATVEAQSAEAFTPELRTFEGSAIVTAVKFSPDGKQLLAIGNDNCIHIWQVADGVEVKRLINSGAAGGPANRTLPIGANYINGYGARAMLGPPAQNCLAVSGDGKTIACGSNDGTVALWDAVSGKRLRSIPAQAIHAVEFSRDGATIASAQDTGNIRIWNIETGTEALNLPSRGGKVRCVAFNDDGSRLQIAGDITETWEIQSGRVIQAPQVLAISRDGRLCARESSGNSLQLYNNATQKSIATLPHIRYWPCCFSCDGDLFATGDSDQNLRIYHSQTGEPICNIHTESDISSCTFGANDKTVIVGGGLALSRYGTGVVSIFDIANGKLLKSLTAEGHIESLRLSADGKTLATGAWDTVKLWDLASGKELRTLRGHQNYVESLAFNSDGSLLASGCVNATIKIWNVASGAELRTLRRHSDLVTSLEFDPGSRLLVSSSYDGTVKVFRTADWTELCTIHPLPNKEWIVSDSQGRFDASDLDNLQDAHWVVPDVHRGSIPLAIIPVETFMRQYYTPRLLNSLAAGAVLPAVPSIARLNRLQPQVAITQITSDGKIPRLAAVKVEYKSMAGKDQSGKAARSGVYDLRLFRDGQLVAYLPDGKASFAAEQPADLSAGTDKTYTHTFSVRLPESMDGKDVNFTAYAFNNDKVKSPTATRSFRLNGERATGQPNAYVIAFGVNRYDDPKWNLKFAAADAHSHTTELADVIRASGQYKKAVALPLISEEGTSAEELPATKAMLHCALDALSGKRIDDQVAAKLLLSKGFEKSGPDDLVIIAFSCHGDTNQSTGEYYIFPSDIGKDTEHGLTAELARHGVSSAELTDWMRDIDGADIVMIIDSCHSGAAAGEGFKPGPMDSPGLGQLAYYKKMHLLSASKSNSLAKERHELKHGLLTYALIKQGLEQGLADFDPKDGCISLKEWLRYGAEAVPMLDRGKVDIADAQRDVEVVHQQRPDVVQTPVLLDFSDDDKDALLVKTTKKN